MSKPLSVSKRIERGPSGVDQQRRDEKRLEALLLERLRAEDEAFSMNEVRAAVQKRIDARISVNGLGL